MQSVTGLRLVAEGHTMVLRGRRMVLVVFSSRLPIVSVTGWQLVGDESETSRRPVADRSKYRKIWVMSSTGVRLFANWSPTGLRQVATGHRSVTDQLQPRGNCQRLIADAVPL